MKFPSIKSVINFLAENDTYFDSSAIMNKGFEELMKNCARQLKGSGTKIFIPTEAGNQLLKLTESKQRIILFNKTDLPRKINLDIPHIDISALNSEGIALLEKALLDITKINEFNANDNNYLSNTRHVALMSKALDSLKSAYNACLNHIDVDMIEIDIKDAWYKLGSIIGEESPELLINELFSKFCLGK